MTFWQFLDARAARAQRRWELRALQRALDVAAGRTWFQRFKGPTERQGVTIAAFGLTTMMLLMAREEPGLWNIKLFEVLIQGIFLTGLISMIFAFHFAANKSDERRADADEARAHNTGKLADAFQAVAQAASGTVSPDDPRPAGTTDDPVYVVPEENPDAKP